MIFVTVGTHEQSFNRLLKKIDELKKDGIIQEDVIMQTGFSTYEPKYCEWSKLIPYQQMIKNVEDARIIITHGGPASFIMPLQIGKTPIVVPRQHRFDEHVNDHQVEFARNVAERMGTIIPVEDISTLGDVIKNYDDTEHDNSGPSHFVRNKDVAQKEINRQWMESDGLVNYLGEWHTHAQVNPKPSIVDLSLLRQIIKDHSSLWPHLLMLILGQAGSAILIVVEQKRKRRMQFKVEVNFSNAGVCNR